MTPVRSVIDPHIHLWSLSDGRDIWIRERIEALSRDFSLADFHAQSGRARLAVEGVHVVQASATVEETAHYLEEGRRDPFIRGVVGWVDLEDDPGRLGETLDRLAATGHLSGIRAYPRREFDIGWLALPAVQRGLSLLARRGLPVDALANCTQLAALREALAPLDDLVAVVNHSGRPFVMTGNLTGWREDIAALAARPRTWCKLSGLVERAGVEWTAATLRPWVGALLDTFGPERLIYASNWPVMTLMSTYARWLDTLDALLDEFGLDAGERAAIFRDNAMAVYERGD